MPGMRYLIPVLLLAACTSAPSEEAATTTAPTTPADPTSLTLSCALADEAQVAAVEAAMKPDFAASQVIVVSAAETPEVAVLAFVAGPGKSVLAQWVAPDASLAGLTSAEKQASDVSTAASGTPDEVGAALVAELASCYTEQFAPEQ